MIAGIPNKNPTVVTATTLAPVALTTDAVQQHQNTNGATTMRGPLNAFTLLLASFVYTALISQWY